MSDILLAVGSAQNDTADFRLDADMIPAKVNVYGGAGAASASLWFSPDNGSNFYEYYLESVVFAITEGVSNTRAIDAPGIYRVKKTTVGDGAVSVSYRNNL